MCLETLVQEGLAHMWGIMWRSVPAKFKTGMCEMKILGSEVFWARPPESYPGTPNGDLSF